MRLHLRPILGARLGLWAAWGTIFACSSDHDLLAEKPDAAMSADVGVIFGNTGGSANQPRDSGSSVVDAEDPEPPGPWTLTWVNGVVDEPATRICFVPVIDGKEVPPTLLPLPTGGELPFGGKLLLKSIPGIDPATQDVHPYLVPQGAGFDLATTCDALLGAGDAGSSGILSLPIIPAGTLSDSRSYLAVATGCTKPVAIIDGGTASDKPTTSGETVCGPESGSPSASLVLVRLSRLDVSPKLGFQFVHASAATPEAVLVFSQPLSGNALLSVNKIGFGQIAPPHEAKVISRADLRDNVGLASVRISAGGGALFPVVEAPLSGVLEASGLDAKSLDASDTFTFVFVGARPGKTPPSPWHPFRVLLVENAPPGSSSDGG